MKTPRVNIFKVLAVSCAGLLMFACAASDMEIRQEPEVVVMPPSPRELFLEKCSRCHESGRGYSIIGNREQWIKKVASMSAKDFNWISTNEMQNIISYYDDHTGFAEALFNQKCSVCHRREDLVKLEKSDAQWRTMITFMGKRSVDGLDKDETEVILILLTE